VETEIDGECPVDRTPERMAGIEIGQHRLAESRHFRPQIGGAKHLSGDGFGGVGRQFQPDIVGFLQIGRHVRIERLALHRDVAAIVGGVIEYLAFDHLVLREERCGSIEGCLYQFGGNGMVGDIEKAGLAAGLADFGGDLRNTRFAATRERRNVDDGNGCTHWSASRGFCSDAM
jgi:hypothetical protein